MINQFEGNLEGDNITAEEYERNQWWLENHPEPEVTKREAGPEIAEFETMIADFEKEHPLEALLAITELTVEDAPHHPIREPARIALIPITAKFEVLKKETTISDGELQLLEAKRKRLSMAVGLVNTKEGKVYHDR